jgi:DNA (cytosine-5)-methyltransferase 1
VEEALADLPRLSAMGSHRPGCRQVGDLLPYESMPENEFQNLMRTWPGLGTRDHVSGNVFRRTPRDFPIFARMKEADTYIDAIRIAETILEEELVKWNKERGREPSHEELRMLRKASVPPYAKDKFDTKWWKLSRNLPSHTVVAHLSVDGYSHIHFDSDQARSITVREAARLQSFPDGFRFVGSLSDAFGQIGNAVPPLLAFHLGRVILEALGR